MSDHLQRRLQGSDSEDCMYPSLRMCQAGGITGETVLLKIYYERFQFPVLSWDEGVRFLNVFTTLKVSH